MSLLSSKPKRIGIRHLFQRFCFERSDSRCLIKPYVLIELSRQNGLKIVTRKFGIRPIDHSDRALKAWFSQGVRRSFGPRRRSKQNDGTLVS